MRFLRVGTPGSEIPAAIVPGNRAAYDLSSLTHDIDGEFLQGWSAHEQTIMSGALPRIDISRERLGAPITRPHAIYAIGLNYQLHADETNLSLPTEPLVFSKTPNSICGPTDDIVLPPGSETGDWEVELGVVIGQPAYRLQSIEDSSAVIAGFVAANDVSERSWQFEHGGQWLKGKSFPTANPIGPYLVTPDELDNLADLSLTLHVNGQERQNGNTADLVFSVDYIIWYLSQFVRLEPGDLINTGTPAGVGFGMSPPSYLENGDLVELFVSGLGQHRNRVRIPVS